MVIFRLPSFATVSWGQLWPMSVDPTTVPFTVTRLPLAWLLNATCEMPVITNVYTRASAAVKRVSRSPIRSCFERLLIFVA